jgi:hypothetical protein
MSCPFSPLIERFGYRWLRAADGLYYSPLFPGEDAHLVWLEERGKLGHSSARRGEYRYFLRFPEEDPACWLPDMPSIFLGLRPSKMADHIILFPLP